MTYKYDPLLVRSFLRDLVNSIYDITEDKALTTQVYQLVNAVIAELDSDAMRNREADQLNKIFTTLNVNEAYEESKETVTPTESEK